MHTLYTRRGALQRSPAPAVTAHSHEPAVEGVRMISSFFSLLLQTQNCPHLSSGAVHFFFIFLKDALHFQEKRKRAQYHTLYSHVWNTKGRGGWSSLSFKPAPKAHLYEVVIPSQRQLFERPRVPEHPGDLYYVEARPCHSRLVRRHC